MSFRIFDEFSDILGLLYDCILISKEVYHILQKYKLPNIYVFPTKIVSDFDSSLWEDYYFIKFFGEKLGIEYFNLKMEVLYVESYSYVENKRRC